MAASFITTVLFALSAVTGARTTRLLGSLEANFWRLIVASLLLAAWAHLFGQGLGGPALNHFLVSGAIGFGLGDIALYHAYARIGSRLSILLTQCLAAPFGAAMEWLWLGTELSLPQSLWAAVILAGVVVAMLPRPDERHAASDRWAGVACGVVAALGQAGGAVISRRAFAIASSAHFPIDGLTAAYQRILAGLVIGGATYLLFRGRSGNQDVLINPSSQTPRSSNARTSPAALPRTESAGNASMTDRPRSALEARWMTLGAKWRHAGPWILANSLAGPSLGVGCYQWALATTPTGIVLPIVATTPLAVVPLAYLLENERPGLRSLIGGALAVLGAIGLSRCV
jgi:drug/metabolite transporter (DMT)-like permease